MKKQEQMRMVAGTVVNGKLYFSEARFNGLFCMDLNTYECSFLTHFLEEPFLGGVLHRKCVQWKEWLYFLPERGRFIHAYNLETKKQKCYDLQGIGVQIPYVYEPIIWKNKLFYFSMKQGSPMCVLDLDKQLLERDDRLAEWCNKQGVKKESRFGCRLGSKGEWAYLVEDNQNCIIQWNLETGEGEVVKSDMHHLFGAVCVDKGLWLYARDNSSLHYRDISKNEHECAVETNCEGGTYNHVIGVGKVIVAVPKQGREIFYLEQGEKSFKCVDVLEGLPVDSEDELRFFGYDIDGMVVYLFLAVGQGLIKFDTEEKTVEWIPTVITDEKEQNRIDMLYTNHLWKTDGIVYEVGRMTLKSFLLLNADVETSKKEETIGEVIYNACL